MSIQHELPNSWCVSVEPPSLKKYRTNIWGVPKIGVPQNGWFIMENPIKMGWFGGTTIFGNIHINLWMISLYRSWRGGVKIHKNMWNWKLPGSIGDHGWLDCFRLVVGGLQISGQIVPISPKRECFGGIFRFSGEKFPYNHHQFAVTTRRELVVIICPFLTEGISTLNRSTSWCLFNGICRHPPTWKKVASE